MVREGGSVFIRLAMVEVVVEEVEVVVISNQQ